ncbi:MAG: hypothetical protein AB1599_10765 [Planctomycetota bacterium]
MSDNPAKDSPSNTFLDPILFLLRDEKIEQAETFLNDLVAKEPSNPLFFFWRAGNRGTSAGG